MFRKSQYYSFDSNTQTSIILATHFMKVKICKRIITSFNLKDKHRKQSVYQKRKQRTQLKIKNNNIGSLNCEQTPVVKGLPGD